MQEPSYHTPVLLAEVLSYLVHARRGVYVDGTLGGGGHAGAILEALESPGSLIGIDADDDALRYASARLAPYGNRYIQRKGNFRDLGAILRECRTGLVDGILLDLGVSSHQLDEPGRGFSFVSDRPLDMRMDQSNSLTAEEVVNEYDEGRLAEIIWNYGEERHARSIARAIVRTRQRKRLRTGKELSGVLEDIVSERFLTKTLARVFQAIRIEVNTELESLRQGLVQSVELLKPGGRLVVISYHSLEDRIVKETFKAASATSDSHRSKFLPPANLNPKIKVLTKKFVGPGEPEIRMNPRARSAKLRAAEKL